MAALIIQRCKRKPLSTYLLHGQGDRSVRFGCLIITIVCGSLRESCSRDNVRARATLSSLNSVYTIQPVVKPVLKAV